MSMEGNHARIKPKQVHFNSMQELEVHISRPPKSTTARVNLLAQTWHAVMPHAD